MSGRNMGLDPGCVTRCGQFISIIPSLPLLLWTFSFFTQKTGTHTLTLLRDSEKEVSESLFLSAWWRRVCSMIGVQSVVILVIKMVSGAEGREYGYSQYPG